MKKLRLALIILFFLTTPAHAEINCDATASIANPEEFFRVCRARDQRENEQDYTVIWRIIKDFTGDGHDDYAFSFSDECGTGGCWWEVYVWTALNTYTEIPGGFDFHPGAINFDNVSKPSHEIVTYSHGSSTDGVLSRTVVTAAGVKDISDEHLITADGTPGLKRVEALFDKLDDHPVSYKCRVKDFRARTSIWNPY